MSGARKKKNISTVNKWAFEKTRNNINQSIGVKMSTMTKEYGDNELVPVRMGEKFGYVNLKGEMVIPAQFDGALEFHDGLACVECEDKRGFINKQGELCIPCRYVNTGRFDGEYCMAAFEWGSQGLINRKGDFVIEPIYDCLTHFYLNGHRVFFNDKGEQFWKE